MLTAQQMADYRRDGFLLFRQALVREQLAMLWEVPLPPAPDSSSLFMIQQSGGAADGF